MAPWQCVPFGTALRSISAVRCRDEGTDMPAHHDLPQSKPRAATPSDVISVVPSRRDLERRLAYVERELRVQFRRTAQLQAELDRALIMFARLFKPAPTAYAGRRRAVAKSTQSRTGITTVRN